jgi:hypothetical protein
MWLGVSARGNLQVGSASAPDVLRYMESCMGSSGGG